MFAKNEWLRHVRFAFWKPHWMKRSGVARTTESIKVMHKSESGSKSRFSPQSYCNTRGACCGSIYALCMDFCSRPRKTGMLMADTGSVSGGSTHSPPQSCPQQPCIITAAVLLRKPQFVFWTVLRALAVKMFTLFIVTMILLLLK